MDKFLKDIDIFSYSGREGENLKRVDFLGRMLKRVVIIQVFGGALKGL